VDDGVFGGHDLVIFPDDTASAAASPVTTTVVAHPATAALVPAATPPVHLKHHKTARLWSAGTRAGHEGCFAIRQTDSVQPTGMSPNALSPNATPPGYGPSTLAAAYSLDQSQGSGRTVAIVDAYDDPSAESDLAAYRTLYGLPPCTTAGGCFKKVSQSGSTTILPIPDAGWAGEIALDLDMVSATCPNCHILLVEADDISISNLGTAVNRAVTLGAKYVSNSYGGPESDNGAESVYDSAYYRHAGVVITAAAGDSGYGAAYPATGASVTAVGGTSLTSANNPRGWSETVWDTSSTESTGSGCSVSISQPAFQANLQTGCSNRAEVDVSAVADPNTGVAVYDSYRASGWQVYGGTSVASPIIASVYALAGNPGASDSPNAYPYAHPSNLFDVTSGSNGICSLAVLCTAGTGWDGPSGLGTPNGSAAFSGTARSSTPGGFTPLAPARLLDTRSGLGAPRVAVPAGGTVQLQVAGHGQVPASGVSAVVLNVTVTAPTSPGWVTVYGDGTLPGASNLNFVAGQTAANLVITPVGANGTVSLHNGSSGTVQLVVDVSGYYLA
jgi:subtilase family serine protease